VSLFRYRCLRKHVFDELHAIGTAPDTTKCPDCGMSAQRLLSMPAVHFNGQGFSRSSVGGATKETP
jgi:putative FmdB family regulatory protein